MQQSGLAQRYGQALFGAAQARQAAEDVASDFEGFLALDERDPSLRLFLESPQVRDDHKHALVDSVLGKRAHALTTRFFHLLLEKKRLPYLRSIAHAYAALIERHRGILRARVITAVPLAEDQKTKLAAALERRTGKRILLEPRVEPEVLGGVAVQLGDQILDDTVSTRLAEIREVLLATEV